MRREEQTACFASEVVPFLHSLLCWMLSTLSKRLGSTIGSTTTRIRSRSPSTSPTRIRFSSNMVSEANQRYLADREPPVCSLAVKSSFANLTKQESEHQTCSCTVSARVEELTLLSRAAELYSHFMSQACWSGGRIIMRQTTETAEQLYDLVVSIFAHSDQAPNKLGDLEQLKSKSGVSQEDWNDTLAYCAQVSLAPPVDTSLFGTNLSFSTGFVKFVQHQIFRSDQVHS